MKKIALITLLVLACVPMMRAQENKVRVPSGYQGFQEQGNSFRVADKFSSAISLSTTHGFYFGQHTFVGIGIGVEGNNDFTVVPVYTALKYNFNYTHQATPTLQVRVGSFLADAVGSYCDLAFGVRFGSSRDFAINVLLTGSLYSNCERTRWVYGDTKEYYDPSSHYEKYNFNPSSIGLRIGIEW